MLVILKIVKNIHVLPIYLTNLKEKVKLIFHFLKSIKKSHKSLKN